jgi:hypothetical protein
MRLLIGYAALFVSLAGGEVTDRFVVELDAPSAAELARQETGGRRLRPSAGDYERVRREQELFRRRLRRLPGSEAVEVLTTLSNAVVVRTSEESAERLKSLPGVRQVYRVISYRRQMDAAAAVHHIPEAWSAAGGWDRAGEGVMIGILDSCIETSHPAFQDPWLPMPAGFPRATTAADLAYTTNKVILTRNYKPMYGVGGDLRPVSPNGHGTNVASVAAGARHLTPAGVFSGVAPKAWLGNYCMANPGSGDAFDSDVVAKAIDDAAADGMDVINLSLGSPTGQLRPKDDIVTKLLERAEDLGVIVVKSAGNYGPNPATAGDLAALPPGITVGATWNSRLQGTRIAVDGVEYIGVPSAGTGGLAPLTAPVADVRALDGTGFGCVDLPPGSLSGKIAFMTLGGGCKTAEKAKKAQAGGAMAALIGADADLGEIFRIGQRAIPSVTVDAAAAEAIRSRIAANPSAQATLRFDVQPVPYNPHRITSFSSRGPTGTYQIKPDVVAVGAELYLAAPNGQYTVSQGTSFSAPIVAGAAAVLKAARPGLSPVQYKSLLVNTAAEPRLDGGALPRVMDYGAGILDLEAALRSTVAVSPVSVSFGVTNGTVDTFRRLLVMNLSDTATECDVWVLRLGDRRDGKPPQTTLAIPARQARPLRIDFRDSNLAPGEYQGFVEILARDGSLARVPYWGAVRQTEPHHVTILQSAERGDVGRRINRAVIFRVTDENGVMFADLTPAVTVVQGGGQVASVYSRDWLSPGEWAADVVLGPEPGQNVFRVGAGPVSEEVTIAGELAPTGNQRKDN